ncbi:MAG: YhcH/YjgK/YiaL family protein [Bdellovibrionaceae bacterium]|nr:YhcH/YjgK/YiaL family protein [Pseudobdellovibrionaceae bacterium]|tara:strand:+ start:98568 stop:99041 length:474 start_codon:yes stop_codon:yes gene_type:complete
MYYGSLDQVNDQLAEGVVGKALEFISSLGPNSEDSRIELEDGVFAIVMSYETKDRHQAVLESHRKYVDIQSTLAGAEGMEYYLTDHLVIQDEYSDENDVIFYEHPEKSGKRIDVQVGECAVFFPKDGHMPQLHVGEPRTIKKVVVKIPVTLFGNIES